MFLTFEVGQLVNVNKRSRAVLESDADNFAAVSYNMITILVSNPYKIVTVRDNILTILQNGYESTLSIDRATNAAAPQEIPCTDGSFSNSRELSLTQANDVDDNNSSQFIVGKVIRHVSGCHVTKCVVRCYGYPDEKDIVEPPHHLTHRFMFRY